MKFEDTDFEEAVRILCKKEVWQLLEIKKALQLKDDLDTVKFLLFISEIGLIDNDITHISIHPHALIKLIWSDDAECIITTKIHCKKDGSDRLASVK